MKEFRQFALGIIVIILLSGLFNSILSRTEPVWQGKSLSDWLAAFDRCDPFAANASDNIPAAAAKAVRGIGTNGLPVLLKMLSQKDTLISKAFRDLASKQSIAKFNFVTDVEIRRRAGVAFTVLSTNATTVKRQLALLLNDGELAPTSAVALAAVGRESIPILTAALTNHDARVRASATAALVLVDWNPDVSAAVVNCLEDQATPVRANAAFALGRKRASPELAVPALARHLLPFPDGTNTTSTLVAAFWALGEFGVQAKSTTPLLLELIRTNGPGSGSARDALRKIDPGLTAKPSFE